MLPFLPEFSVLTPYREDMKPHEAVISLTEVAHVQHRCSY